MGVIPVSEIQEALEEVRKLHRAVANPHREFQLHQEARQADRDHDRIQRAESSVQAVVDDTVDAVAHELLNAALAGLAAQE
jgi:restriction endonuclease Mrr